MSLTVKDALIGEGGAVFMLTVTQHSLTVAQVDVGRHLGLGIVLACLHKTGERIPVGNQHVTFWISMHFPHHIPATAK